MMESAAVDNERLGLVAPPAADRYWSSSLDAQTTPRPQAHSYSTVVNPWLGDLMQSRTADHRVRPIRYFS
jgi:hypothetical protein